MTCRASHSTLLRTALLALLLCTAPLALAEGWKLKDTGGQPHTLAGYQGKWVLVTFWAPWCSLCIDEMPGFNAVQKRHADLQVIGIAVMYRKRKEVLDVARQQALAYPVVFGNEDIASEFGELRGVPVSYWYDPAGRLVGRHDGPLSADQLEQAMARDPAATALFSPAK